MPSRSGQVKEAGSVHRRGVAVYLAAHGLASRSVAAADPGPGNPTPTALEFETAYATDDLLCTCPTAPGCSSRPSAPAATTPTCGTPSSSGRNWWTNCDPMTGWCWLRPSRSASSGISAQP